MLEASNLNYLDMTNSSRRGSDELQTDPIVISANCIDDMPDYI